MTCLQGSPRANALSETYTQESRLAPFIREYEGYHPQQNVLLKSHTSLLGSPKGQRPHHNVLLRSHAQDFPIREYQG